MPLSFVNFLPSQQIFPFFFALFSLTLFLASLVSSAFYRLKQLIFPHSLLFSFYPLPSPLTLSLCPLCRHTQQICPCAFLSYCPLPPISSLRASRFSRGLGVIRRRAVKERNESSGNSISGGTADKFPAVWARRAGRCELAREEHRCLAFLSFLILLTLYTCTFQFLLHIFTRFPVVSCLTPCLSRWLFSVALPLK